jgi:hypothetical protein
MYKAKPKKSSASDGKIGKAAASSAMTVTDESDNHVPSHNDDDLDEEQVRLEELLDDLTLSMSAAGAGSNSSSSAAIPADAVEMEATSILSPEVAAQVNRIDIGSTGFDPADYDVSKFKFS